MLHGKRILFTAPLQSEWEDVHVPEQLEPYEIVIKAHQSLISAGTELTVATGTHIGFRLPGGSNFARFPFRPGYTMVGHIAALGQNTGEFVKAQVGDRVLATVPHSSITVADVRRTLILPLQEEASNEQALLARLAAISMVGIRMGEVMLGDSVAVIGQGLIGQLAAQLARAAGARPVFGIDLLQSRLAITQLNGITPLLGQDRAQIVESVHGTTGGKGTNVVIEATGNPQAILTALELAAPQGRVVLLGSPRGTIELDPYTLIHRPGVQLIGAHEMNSHQQETRETRWTSRRNIELSLHLFIDGTLKSNSVISHRIPAKDALGIHAMLHAHPEQYLGVLIDWT